MQIIPPHIPARIIQHLTPAQARHYGVLPYDRENDTLWLFTGQNPPSSALQEELEVLLGLSIQLVRADPLSVNQSIGKYYRDHPAHPTSPPGREQDLLREWITEAQRLDSSDIHLEPYEHRTRVRFRIDGLLTERYELPPKDYPALVNQVKVKANLDIAEKRLPQDGRIRLAQESGENVDIRISILPTLHGEKVVMRLLGKDASHIQLEETGMEPAALRHFLNGVQRQTGMVLISGPTGSGKTTTLYATLQYLNQSTRNILTIEDPIEYTLEGINQVRLREGIGFDFANAMRTFLRQDPDIIMVGEIRDTDTAEMAVRASLTGHLVLSTLHTNSAWGIVARLADMGVPSYLLADTLNTAVAQRLVRLLCPDCKQEEVFQNSLLTSQYTLPRKPNVHYVATGCEKCFFTGYAGRKAIFEVIPIDGELRQCIRELQLDTEKLRHQKGIRNLADHACNIFEKGLTSYSEIVPVLAETGYKPGTA